MKPCLKSLVIASCLASFTLIATTFAEEKAAAPTTAPATMPATRPTPKALSDNVKKGLAWLVEHQQKAGGWSQGEESKEMTERARDQNTPNVSETANVTDTSMACLALIRAGSTPSNGDHADNICRALDFICKQVENSDSTSLSVTDIKGTRVQQKLGSSIDTFAAALVLSEAKEKMPDEAGNKRIGAALDKITAKIEKNQQKDGAWAKDGWANALSQNMASKALNSAAMSGAKVDETVRQNVEKYSQGQTNANLGGTVVASGAGVGGIGTDARIKDGGDKIVAGDTGVEAGGSAPGGTAAPTTSPSVVAFPLAEGTAGVPLYGLSSAMNSLRQSDNANQSIEPELRKIAESPTTQPEARDSARRELKRIESNRAMLKQAEEAVIKKMEDPRFVAGFGNNGGEEFLSHLNIGESLVLKGGDDWAKWDKTMTENLNKIQNGDGSWSGHHCITGRTFCTSAALMVLTLDRSPSPVTSQIKKVK